MVAEALNTSVSCLPPLPLPSPLAYAAKCESCVNPCMSKQTHVLSLKRPAWVAKGAIVLHESPEKRQQTLFVLHKLQQLRGSQAVYLLPSDDSNERYPLDECQPASWANFSTLQTLRVGSEHWSMTHPHQQLAEHADGTESGLSLRVVWCRKFMAGF